MPNKKISRQELPKQLTEEQSAKVLHIQTLVTKGIESGKGSRSMNELKSTVRKAIKGL